MNLCSCDWQQQDNKTTRAFSYLQTHKGTVLYMIYQRSQFGTLVFELNLALSLAILVRNFETFKGVWRFLRDSGFFSVFKNEAISFLSGREEKVTFHFETSLPYINEYFYTYKWRLFFNLISLMINNFIK